ncbi:uncharacterized protein N7500_003765 [Penicillium coprophilum]|uniref:uncharacterized protein n=1 Tax=Penicillium coprophilum TaxID=36646 RepID=UPI00239FF864|nr:uncharacterized protein N7500_003765 [Penicillium coprophilum]KAJ5170982.1 hypothetical protein N7500_003765 [Penicillium coprophilum]
MEVKSSYAVIAEQLGTRSSAKSNVTVVCCYLSGISYLRISMFASSLVVRPGLWPESATQFSKPLSLSSTNQCGYHMSSSF